VLPELAKSNPPVVVSRRLPPASFLEAVRPLQTFRYHAFVICYCSCHLLAVALLLCAAFLAVFGNAGSRSDQARLLWPLGMSIGSGACGAWLRRLARNEEQNIAEQQEREMRMQQFQAEEDQRHRENAMIDELLKKLDAMPLKSREKVIPDTLARLLQRRQRTPKSLGT